MYSQHDEEAVLLKHLPDHGKLLDCGSYDGRTFSNALALIEKGWSAVCIEADPGCFTDLLNLHRNNRNVELICALAGPTYELKKFYSSKAAVATSEESNYQKWKHAQGDFREIHVPQVPIDVLARGDFDFVSIDTEGSSVQLLQSIDWKLKGVKVICVEFDSHEIIVRNWFQRHGYEVIHRTPENLIAKLKGWTK